MPSAPGDFHLLSEDSTRYWVQLVVVFCPTFQHFVSLSRVSACSWWAYSTRRNQASQPAAAVAPSSRLFHFWPIHSSCFPKFRRDLVYIYDWLLVGCLRSCFWCSFLKFSSFATKSLDLIRYPGLFLISLFAENIIGCFLICTVESFN